MVACLACYGTSPQSGPTFEGRVQYANAKVQSTQHLRTCSQAETALPATHTRAAGALLGDTCCSAHRIPHAKTITAITAAAAAGAHAAHSVITLYIALPMS